MSDAVTVQTIATVGLVIATVGAAWIQNRKLKDIAADAAEARTQTANTHDTNLRDDMDEIKREVKSQGATQRQMQTDVRGIRRDINGLREDDGDIRETIAVHAKEQKLAVKAVHDDLTAHISDSRQRSEDERSTDTKPKPAPRGRKTP